VDNFNSIPQYETKLYGLLRDYCQHTTNLTVESCAKAFYQALFSTIRTIGNQIGSNVNSETQFAWRCFTNDLQTMDIFGAFEIKRPSTTSASRHSGRTAGSSSAGTGGTSSAKRGGTAGRDKCSDEKNKQPAAASESHGESNKQ